MDGVTKMTYKGYTCGWFRENGCLFFTYDINKEEYLQYDRRALPGLKKIFKSRVDGYSK